MENAESKELSIQTPYVPTIIKSAQTFREQMNLPVEAMSSIVYTLDSWNNLNEVVKRQRALPPEERKKLIKTQSNLAIQVVAVIDAYVEMHQIPYNCMTWVEGQPYPTAEGLRYKIRADARVVKSVRTQRIEVALDGPNPRIGYHCDIEFWNGEHYDADGWADMDELKTRRRNTKPPISFMCMIAETRSVRRATVKALGLPSSVAEDVQEGKEFDEGVTEKVVVVENAARVKVEMPDVNQMTRAAFLTKCQAELNFNPEQVGEKILTAGVKLEEVTDFQKAFDYLKGLAK